MMGIRLRFLHAFSLLFVDGMKSAHGGLMVRKLVNQNSLVNERIKNPTSGREYVLRLAGQMF